MGVFKSLVDKLKGKKEEMQQKAAERALDIAVQQGKDAARAAASRASKAVEDALFGDDEESREVDAPKSEPDAAREAREAKEREAAKKREAKLAKEREAERAREAKERAVAAAREEREIDDELAAMKKRLGKK